MHELLIDLAQGGQVLEASDEYLNPADRLLDPAEPVAEPGRSGGKGAWLDGWETRRVRPPGHEWVIVQLGLRGVLHHIVIDTSHVTTSLPAACSVEAIDLPGDPNLIELMRNRSLWEEVVPRTDLRGSGRHGFRVDGTTASHLRLVVYPDGGVARIRALGDPLPPADLADRGELDLAAIEFGGRVTDASDIHTSSPNLMLGAGDARDHTDAWMTGRRRGPGNEWAIIRLAGRATVEQITVDTRHFPGDSPEEIAVMAMDAAGTSPAGYEDSRWSPLLSHTPVKADTRNRFDIIQESGPVTHLRLDLHPDGAVARFRAHGTAVSGWDVTG